MPDLSAALELTRRWSDSDHERHETWRRVLEEQRRADELAELEEGA